MRLKKTMVSLIFVSFLLVFASSSFASDWLTCTVVKTGPGWDRVYVMLTDNAATPAFTKKWCIAQGELIKNRVLAAALTSLTNGGSVNVCLDDKTSSLPIIIAFYIE
jgi:hypothetical protein